VGELLCLDRAVTLVSDPCPDSVYDEVRKHFNEKEIVDLTLVLTTINAWNRLAVALRAVPGHYRPASSAAAAS
jgi:alkylhydroperoxidase family enzyme